MSDDALIEKIAEACHAADRVLQKYQGQTPARGWDKLDLSTKVSIRANVRAILGGSTPQEMHATWLKDRQEQGWVRGYVKDAATKVSPSIVPYNQLPALQKEKDALFYAIVRALGFAPKTPAQNFHEGASGL